MKVLALSGSLRAVSVHAALLDAAALVAPPGASVAAWRGVAALPHFNPDEDVEPLPEPVAAWKRAVAGADALVISSPEYAHGIPGALKNALDWLVSGFEAPGKPVALWSVTPGGVHLRAQLEEVLRTMSTRFVAEACVTLPLRGSRLDAAGIAAAHGAALGDALRALLRAAEERPAADRPA